MITLTFYFCRDNIIDEVRDLRIASEPASDFRPVRCSTGKCNMLDSCSKQLGIEKFINWWCN